MRCERCQYWRRLDTHAVPDLVPGHCHRNPPVPIGSGHDALSARRDANAWSHPVLYASAWCGEFKEVV